MNSLIWRKICEANPVIAPTFQKRRFLVATSYQLTSFWWAATGLQQNMTSVKMAG
jgi:hypothetical protein